MKVLTQTVPEFPISFNISGPSPTMRAMTVCHTVMTINILTPASKSKHLLIEPASFLQAPILEILRFLLIHIHFANGNFKSALDKRKVAFQSTGNGSVRIDKVFRDESLKNL